MKSVMEKEATKNKICGWERSNWQWNLWWKKLKKNCVVKEGTEHEMCYERSSIWEIKLWCKKEQLKCHLLWKQTQRKMKLKKLDKQMKIKSVMKEDEATEDEN